MRCKVLAVTATVALTVAAFGQAASGQVPAAMGDTRAIVERLIGTAPPAPAVAAAVDDALKR